MAAPDKVAKQQTTPQLSGTFRTLPPVPTPAHTGTLRKLPPEPTLAHTRTLRNLPELTSRSYTSTHRNCPEPSATCLRNLHQHTPELSGTFRNLQPSTEPTPAHTGTLRNLPEPSGTCRNLHQQHTGTLRNLPEPASGTYTSTYRNSPEPPAHTGTFRNLPPESTPAHTGTLRNLPEPASGTGSCDPHRNTPELIWAEDPFSLRCWGKYCLTGFSISFGGNPNSSSIMPGLTTWAHSCSAVVLPMRTMSSPKCVQKPSHGCPCQGCKFYGTFRKLHPEPTPAHAGTGTLRNFPEPASGTYTSAHRNSPQPSGTCLRTPAHTGTFQNLPERAGTYTTGTFRNLPPNRNPPEPSGTCLRNLHQHKLETSGTFRNLHQRTPEPSGTCPGTYTSAPWNPPEPSGTFLRNLLLRPAPAHTGAYLG